MGYFKHIKMALSFKLRIKCAEATIIVNRMLQLQSCEFHSRKHYKLDKRHETSETESRHWYKLEHTDLYVYILKCTYLFSTAHTSQKDKYYQLHVSLSTERL
jgi:hypothetical protein